MKNKGDLERDRDELKAEIESHTNKVQVLERTIEHLKKIIDEKVSKYSTKLQPNLTNIQLHVEHNYKIQQHDLVFGVYHKAF